MNLALNFRPQNLEQFVGQNHLIGSDSALRKLIEQRNIPHCFFYGPPGSGKTTLAKIIAKELDLPYYGLNATSIKIEELRKIFKQYQHALQKPLIFIDEIHRLAKNQQEVLLPVMENHEALIMGCSTEDPSFSLTSAIRSRSMLFEFRPLEPQEMEQILNVVLSKNTWTVEEEAKEYLIHSSGGDGRAMLNLLEYATLSSDDTITLETLKTLRPHALSDGTSSANTHYDLTSAMIKSIRGSDENATIYYLARLIDGGEPPEYIARRLAIHASEDIGNANPQALILASATLQAVQRIGYPEAQIILCQCALYLAASPKSNTVVQSIKTAMQTVQSGKRLPVPANIQQFPKNYLYPHDFGGWVEQNYLAEPLELVNWKPIGFEKTLMEWLKKIRGEKSDDPT